ncbi:MAG TPA: glycosyltransferase [Flavobacteriales bacterium]|jgi:glycosyltransferase involved in cell wall biosynthesis|nr:glycosyltransferase [Flavobacteriales bacterium]
MHILVLPKWYPGHRDPQLGDFIRKQMLGVAQAHRVSVVAVSPRHAEGIAEQELDTDGDHRWELRCHYPPSQAAFGPWRKAVNLLRYWRAGMRGIKRAFAERGRPDLTHVHILVRPALLAWWLQRSRGVPYILSEQSSEYLDGTWARKGPLFKAINRKLFRRAARVTAVSSHLGDALKQLGLAQQVAVVPNVVPGMDHVLPPPGKPGRFMVVADLVDRTKNVSGVLRALGMARHRGLDLDLDVIGDGPDRPQLEALAHTLGLNGSVRWHGRIANSAVLERMAHTGAVIVNSNVETFSVVTGEALALGRPVIATRCGGPQAFITAENGLLIDVRDDQALAEAMITLTRQAGGYRPDAIRRTVSERFGPAAIGAAFTAVYTEALRHG